MWACVLQFKLSFILVSLYICHALILFNETSVTIYLMYPLQVRKAVYKLKLLHKCTKEHTLIYTAEYNLSLLKIQITDFLKIIQFCDQSTLMC